MARSENKNNKALSGVHIFRFYSDTVYSFREGQFSLDYYANSAPKIVQDNNATRI